MSKYDFTTCRTLTSSPPKVRNQLEQFVFKAGSGIPCLITVTFLVDKYESTTHTFLLDRDEWWFDNAKLSFLRYLDSFSDDFLNDVQFIVYY